MSPAASAALSLVALVLAIGAIVLATIANRRWVARDRSLPPPRVDPPATADRIEEGGQPALPSQADLVALRAQLAALGEHVADIRSGVERLAPELATVRGDLDGTAGDLSGIRSELATLQADLAALAASPPADPTALRHVALVRYDAFADVGGRLSYSLALLDDTRSGLVLTTLAGKTDVRTYARTISAGTADGTLTAEEQQAIEAAAGPTGSRP